MQALVPGVAAILLCAALPGQMFGERVRTVFEPELTGFIAATLEVDGDGDQDILSSEGDTGHVYLNDGHGRFTWFNSFFAGWNIVGDLNAAVGDLDNDGDLEFCVGTRAFTNQGNGSFAHAPAIAGFGAATLLDTDHDGRADIFNGLGGQANLHTHLHTPFWATPGSQWRLDLETWRFGVTAQLAFVGVGTQEQFVIYPGIGRLYLDSLFADVVNMPIVAGSGQRLFAVPTQPALLGTTLTAQAVVLDDDRLQLSNAVRDRIR